MVYRRNWDQLCQALMWQACAKFGAAPRTYASANAAQAASSIVSTDALAAPAGAFHFWDIGTYGHVALELGGGQVLMGSRHIQTVWAINAGVTTVAAYTRATGAKYKGWSTRNGQNYILIEPEAPVAQSTITALADMQLVAAYLNSRNTNASYHTNVDDGQRGPAYWWAVQHFGREDGVYPEPYKIDREPGPKTYEVEAYHLTKAREWWAAQHPAPAPQPQPEPTPDPALVPVDVEALLTRLAAKVTADVLEGIKNMSFGVK